MSLRSDERAARARHKKLLKRRAAAIRKGNLSNAARLGRLARKALQKAQSLRRQRVYGFKPSMLDGHPSNVTDAVKRQIADAYAWAERKGTFCTITATTDGTHAAHSFHYAAAGQKGRAADINFATEDEERRYQDDLRVRYDLADFYELLGPSGWALYTSGISGGPAPGHYGSNAHVHSAPRDTFRHR